MVGKKVSKALKDQSPKISKGEPQTMEELLAQTGYQIRGLKRDQQVTGTITNITSKAAFVDVGAKAEGIIVGKEFETAREYIKSLKVGDKVEARVAMPEGEGGHPLLSLKSEALTSAWKKLNQAKGQSEEIEVQVKDLIRGGVLVNAFGISGFIPSSQLGTAWQERQDQLIGRNIKVKVIEVDETQNRLILSEKAVSEKEKIEKLKTLIKQFKVGEVVEGTITGIMPFGLFVQVKIGQGEVWGLVHVSELAWGRVVNPEAEYKVGDPIKVKVLGADEEGAKLALSVKQITVDPWQELVKKYEVDSRVSGRVTRMIASGAFIELEPEVEGFLHISKVPVEKKIQVGDILACFIETIEPEKRRISLGLVLTAKPVGYK